MRKTVRIPILRLKTFTDGDDMPKTEYTRVLSGFGGIDVTSDDSNVAAARFPYLVNMWRDFRSENGAAIETFPGWRLIPWQIESEAKAIYSIHVARFFANGSIVDYILIHKGWALFAGKAEDINKEDAVIEELGYVTAGRSRGFQYGNAFYLLDGETIYKIHYDGRLCKEEIGANAYIPTTYSDGAEFEQRNMLTNEFYAKWNINKPEETTLEGEGLRYEPIDTKTARVIGVKDSIRTKIYVPDRCKIDGKTYTVTTIGSRAFSGNESIEEIILAKGVKTIENADSNGAFYGCANLSRFIAHGLEEIEAGARNGCFGGCDRLTEMVLPVTLGNVASQDFPSRGGTYIYIYYESGEERAESIGLTSWSGGYVVIVPDCKLYQGTVGDTVTLPYHTEGTADTTVQSERGGIDFSDAYTYEKKASQKDGAWYDIKITERVGYLRLKVVDSKPESRIIITASDEGGVFNKNEDDPYQRFDLMEPTKAVTSVKLNGESVAYTVFKEKINGKEYIRAIVLHKKLRDIQGKELVVLAEAYDSEFSRSSAGEDYKYGNTSYTGTSSEAIKKCTLYAEYDGRIFLTGNPNLPNTVFYSNRNLTGTNDPTYFGQLNYFNDGQGMTPNASLLATPSFLAVIKRDTKGEGSVFYHTAEATEYDVLPKIYPSVQGAANVGSLGPATNFRDDPVFLSSGGLEGISLSAVNSERGIYHRSTFVDKWLLAELKKHHAEIAEWEGYLVILINGKMFLADSRQISKINGTAQYEWYYVDDVGYYEDQQQAYFFPSTSPYDSEGNKLTDLYVGGRQLKIKTAEEEYYGYPFRTRPTIDQEGSTPVKDEVSFVAETDEFGQTHCYIVSSYGEMNGGTYSPAMAICNVGDLLVFGTESGRVCVVNTDKRGEAVGTDEVPRDRIHPSWYTRCGRRYISGFATKKDNCDIPHYDKDTVRRSLVIKAKTLSGSKFSVKVRSDREPWQEVQDSSAAFANAYDVDFANASFLTSEETIRQLRDTSRRWVEKQYYIYSDEFKRPFGIYSISYRYKISGLNGRIRRT